MPCCHAPMSQFLTEVDLFDLTGLKQPAAQARYLRSKGYLFDCNIRGVPRVLWSQVQARQTAESDRLAPTKVDAKNKPNSEALLHLINQRKKTVKRDK